MLNEMFHETVPVILHEDDLNAMYFSIENRSPFLDRNLFEFSMKIPTRYLVREGAAKALLRDAMRGIVPEKILDERRKVGFNAPVFGFLEHTNEKIRKRLMEESRIFSLIRPEKILALLDKESLPNSESKFLFNFICTKLFLEGYD
jgi:asparagine synthase (glutamine-hydrolysing)